MSIIRQYLQRTSFRHQLSIVVAIGVTALALLSSIVLSWQMDRRLQDNFRQQGERIATNLAKQSRLALVFHSADNATEAIRTTLAFPDIVGIDIHTPKHDSIIAIGTSISTPNATPSPDALATRQATLFFDGPDTWQFIAPVFRSAEVEDSPFEMEQKQDELLGYVRVIESKATLKRMSQDIFLVNLGISLGIALVLLLFIRALARRISRPLEQLANVMGQAERGETVAPTEVNGPKDIGAMARAFNSMIEALQDRERQLQQSKDEAVRFAQIKADFAATVSHEIRTPLNGVIGTLDMLKSGPMPLQQTQLVNLAWESSQYLLDLVNNILDFSRLEAGKLEPEHIEFDLRRLLAGVAHTLSPQAVQKGIALRWQLAAGVADKVVGDPTRLRQILVNLVGNAIKFTDSGSVSIEVNRRANNRYHFEVRDTGIGIEQAQLANIFDSFTQADASTTRRFGGSGLGLSISKQLVTLLDGWIDVESKPGAGSCFFFELPLEEATVVVHQAPQPEPTTGPAPRCRVLVVEDNRTNQIIARGMLEMIGAEVGLADNGISGITAYQEQRWDLILMDCNMPKMDGYEATAAIRTLEHGSGKRIPIIAMTANTLPADLTKCLSAGMDDHLTKPLTLESLSEKLRLWLTPGSLMAPAPSEPRSDIAQSLNRKTLEKLREALGDAISDAIRPFLEDMPGYLEAIDQAGTMGDCEKLRRTAHAIKGAASNLGAEALSAVAKSIEEHAAADRADAASPLIDVLHAEYTRVQPVLLAEISPEPATLFSSFDEDMPLVLIVDDDRSTRTTLFHALSRASFRVCEAADGMEALRWLETEVPDVILMDAMMPAMDGFTACARIKAEPDWKDIPILMITALEDQQSVEKAFSAGASDYIPKPIHLSVVNQRVRRIVEATRAERHVRHLAYCDVLTGLPNRRNFNDQLGRALKTSQAKGTHFAVLFLDLDRFKLVNDTLGHEIGDRLLCNAAARIKECIRASDCVSRQGGDEFAILLDDIGTSTAAGNAAQKIVRALSQPFQIDDHELFITASIGISMFPSDGTDASTLLRHADTAMYRAKRTGSHVRFYESEMDSAISAHVKLESDLRHAIERDELVVFYQPVVNAASGNVVGMEALVRWQHPTRGLVSPADFITVAEETGLILPIGEQVLEIACRQAQQWRRNGDANLYVAVNLSGRQIEHGAVVEMVRKVLDNSGLDPAGLVLEITESVLMENARETVTTLEQLRALGVRLSIDDFGTGYSSFSYLRRFPTDTVKIDKSFVQDMHRDMDARAIVTGIIALAHSLRLKVVAEGVETDDQRTHLQDLGCDYLQGYLISKPVPYDVFERSFLTA